MDKPFSQSNTWKQVMVPGSYIIGLYGLSSWEPYVLVWFIAIPFLNSRWILNQWKSWGKNPNSKSNIAGLHKRFFCLVDELKILMYFIGQIAKHASLGNVNLWTLLCSGHSEYTEQQLNSLMRDVGLSSVRKTSTQQVTCHNMLVTHELWCLLIANVFIFLNFFPSAMCCFTCSTSMPIKLACKYLTAAI